MSETTHTDSNNDRTDSDWVPDEAEALDSDDTSVDNDSEVDAVYDAVEGDHVLRAALRSSGDMPAEVEERIGGTRAANAAISMGSSSSVEPSAPNRHVTGSSSSVASQDDAGVRGVNNQLRYLPVVVAEESGTGRTNEWVHSARLVRDPNLPERYFIEVDPSLQFAALYNDRQRLIDEGAVLQDRNLELWNSVSSLAATVQTNLALAAQQQSALTLDTPKNLQDFEDANEIFLQYVKATAPETTPAEKRSILNEMDTHDPERIDHVVDGPQEPSIAGSLARPAITYNQTTGEVGTRMPVICMCGNDRKAKWWCGGSCHRLDQSTHLCGRCCTAIMTPWFLEGGSKARYEAPDENDTHQLRNLCDDLRRAEDAGDSQEVGRVLAIMRAEGIGGIPGSYGKRQCPFCRHIIVGNFVQVTNGYLLPK